MRVAASEVPPDWPLAGSARSITDSSCGGLSLCFSFPSCEMTSTTGDVGRRTSAECQAQVSHQFMLGFYSHGPGL